MYIVWGSPSQATVIISDFDRKCDIRKRQDPKSCDKTQSRMADAASLSCVKYNARGCCPSIARASYPRGTGERMGWMMAVYVMFPQVMSTFVYFVILCYGTGCVSVIVDGRILATCRQ